MPHCESCGNSKTLASTLTAREAPTANPPPYGLLADFSPDGGIITMQCQGSSLDEAQEAYEDPPSFFNICPVCGSGSINWQN